MPNVTFDLVGLQVKGEWDSRNDEFYPLGGSYSTATVNYTTSDTVTRDTSYFRYELAYNGYRSIDERNVLAWRAAFETVSGDALLFGLPWRFTDQNRLNFRIDYGHGRDDETLIISVGEAFQNGLRRSPAPRATCRRRRRRSGGRACGCPRARAHPAAAS